MRILVAIESSENHKKLANGTLKWAARAGFNMRLFVPDEAQAEAYREEIKHLNYNHYLGIPESFVVTGVDPEIYAKEQGYDLILWLPDDLKKWQSKLSHELNVIEYAKDVGAARADFNKDKSKTMHHFKNGAVMRRVI